MPNVQIKANPLVAKVGTLSSDATEIFSEITTNDQVEYEILNRVTQDLITLNNTTPVSGNLVFMSKKKVKIILESRTKYSVRTREQFGPWSAWVTFKTRDKRYQSPDAVTQLSDDTDKTAKTSGGGVTPAGEKIGRNRTIVVTNNALATVTLRDEGALVVNEDKIYNDTRFQILKDKTGKRRKMPIRYTDRGATIVNDFQNIRFTNSGATVNSE